MITRAQIKRLLARKLIKLAVSMNKGCGCCNPYDYAEQKNAIKQALKALDVALIAVRAEYVPKYDGKP